MIAILGGLSAFGPLSMDMCPPGAPGAGPLSDTLGRRRPLLVGLIGYILATLACAAAPSIWTLIVLRFIQGTLGGAGMVIARAVVRDIFSGAEAARIFALLMAVIGVAPVFAPLVGGLHATVQTFGRLLRDRSFIVPASSFGLAAAVLFAYIAGSSFVLEDVYVVSPHCSSRCS